MAGRDRGEAIVLRPRAEHPELHLAIATGHYRSGEKDQTYFLWAVPKDILESTLFPVGNLEKTQVRALAKRFNLPVAEKKDSQGVCFLGSISVEEFLQSEFGEAPGTALDFFFTMIIYGI